MSATGFAPGRVCLLGEHSDWAGGADAGCLVAALAAGVHAEAVTSGCVLEVRSGWGHSRVGPELEPVRDDPHRYVIAAARALRDRGVAWPFARVRLDADLPAGRGLSSSAAVGVAAVRALLALAGAELDDEAIAEVVTTAERDLLGVNCGPMDPLACAVGGLLSVRWGPPALVRRLAGPPLPLLVASRPEAGSAAPLLAALGARVAAGERPLIDVIAAWGRAAAEGADAAARGDLPALGALMNDAQARYEALDLPELAAPAVVATCAALRASGALGAKFTGAGGDRSLVALFATPEEVQAASAALTAEGWQVVG